LESFAAEDVDAARRVIERHSDLGISLADASIVVLAGRHDVRDVLTLDERHFRVLMAKRRPFRLLPADDRPVTCGRVRATRSTSTSDSDADLDLADPPGLPPHPYRLVVGGAAGRFRRSGPHQPLS
jgi:hypothetical protein